MFSRKLVSNLALSYGAICAGTLIHGRSSCHEAHPFNTQGFPAYSKGLFDSDDDLTLVGVGMRRKNLFVVDVDVYMIGLSLSSPAIDAMKIWKADGKVSIPLAEVILNNQMPLIPESKQTIVSVKLRFVRSVSQTQMIQAFEDALKGCDAASIAEFRDGLLKIIDKDRGLQAGDILRFDWPKQGGLLLTSGNHQDSRIKDQGLAQRLLEVYVDDTRTVSKDLVKCMLDNIDAIKAH